MGIRKTRISAMGKTSIDVRSALETKEERKERLPLYQSKYPYHESQRGLPRVKTLPNLIKDPIQSTTDYYKSKKKPTFMRQTLNHPSSSNFAEESLFMTDKIHLLMQKSPINIEEHEEKKVDKYHVSKEVEHKTASQETQLVHIEHHSTLEGKVDLKKVADIRRTIRRRYANRNDFRKIFNQWDENSIGVLTPEDIFKMVNKIGISININEAKVLVASANKSNTGALNLNEFMGLIFDQDDKLNVDLATLADEDEKNVKLLDLHTIAVNTHTEMLQNQLKSFLKEKIYGLIPQLTKKDKKKTGKINFEEFVNVMNNMDVPHTLSSEKTWYLLFKESADGTGLDYKNFLKNIENYNPPIITEKIEKNDKNEKIVKIEEIEDIEENKEINESETSEKPKTDPLKQLNVLNRQKVPVNQLENFFLRARKIRLFLRDSTENEKTLMEELKSRTENNVISLEDLKNFVIDKLQQKKTLKITKKELEGFLSSYIYNKDGVTPIDEVSKNVFMEDTKASFELHQIKRPVAPIREKHMLKSDRLPSLKRILSDIEEKFYDQGPQKANSVFQKFDRDRDGYITEEDIENALKTYQIVHDPEDVQNLMGFLDTNSNGYVTFKEFSNKIRANIVVENKDRLEEDPKKHLLNHQPSLEFLVTQQKNLRHFSETQEKFIKEFKPDDKIIKFHANTRYGSKPVHQNTFVHYHMPSDTSLGQEKIIPKNFLPFNIGGDDKVQKLLSEENKAQKLKNSRAALAENWKTLDEKIRRKDEEKLLHQAIGKNDYEKRCKMTSPFANMSIE